MWNHDPCIGRNNSDMRGSVYIDLTKIQAWTNADAFVSTQKRLRGESWFDSVRCDTGSVLRVLAELFLFFVTWIRRTWKPSGPTIHYVWGAWRLLLNSVQVASDGAAKWKCRPASESTLSVVIFLHESAAHSLGYILPLAGWNMQSTQVSIVVTEKIYWGNRGLKALLSPSGYISSCITWSHY